MNRMAFLLLAGIGSFVTGKIFFSKMEGINPPAEREQKQKIVPLPLAMKHPMVDRRSREASLKKEKMSSIGNIPPRSKWLTDDHENRLIEDLRYQLNSAPDQDVSEVIFKISNMGDIGLRLVDDLIPWLSSQDTIIQETTASAFARLGYEAVIQAVEPLRQLLKSPDTRVQENALFALSKGKGEIEEAVVDIIPLLTEQEPRVVMSALHALSQAGAKATQYQSAIQTLLQHESADIREEASFSTGLLREGGSPAVEELARLAEQDPSSKVRLAATNALKMISGSILN